jgi:hypothetical protein
MALTVSKSAIQIFDATQSEILRLSTTINCRIYIFIHDLTKEELKWKVRVFVT